MKLLTLTLRNFKGVKDLTLDLDGKNVTVYGDNGAGKTTLANAWSWLLFDKDSLNRKDFEIKTLTPEGEAIHGLEHEVEATIDIDGEELTLRKVYSEKWTKTRGSAQATFSGHTTDHYIDGVPVTKRAYTDRIAEIADEGIFRLLTDPRAFNTLHWQDRRKTLLEVCGDVTDADVIASDPSLKDLPGILGKKTLEQHKAIIKKQRAKVNKDIQSIPTRISEVQRGLPDISGLKPEALEADIAKFRALREEKEAEKLRIEQGGEVAEKQKELAEIETEMFRVDGLHRREQMERTEEGRNKLYAIKAARKELEMDISAGERQVKEMGNTVTRHEAVMDALRTEWKEVDSRVMEHEEADTCPTCGQALPAEEVEAAREKALADFNTKKAARLEKIQANGKASKEFVEETSKAVAEMEATLKEQKAILADLLSQEATLQTDIDSKPPVPALENPEYLKLANERREIRRAIDNLRENAKGTLDAIQVEIDTYTQDIKTLEQEQKKLDIHAEAQARIAELKAQDKLLNREFERLMREQDLCDEFTRAKVRMLDEKINSRFRLARFKLFEEQINGGINEVCETLYEGVPWSGGLNNGAQINVGVDIINTLAEHYGFRAPIFADNAESVTQIIPTPAQLIRLVVSAGDKKLRVEVEA